MKISIQGYRSLSDVRYFLNQTLDELQCMMDSTGLQLVHGVNLYLNLATEDKQDRDIVKLDAATQRKSLVTSLVVNSRTKMAPKDNVVRLVADNTKHRQAG